MTRPLRLYYWLGAGIAEIAPVAWRAGEYGEVLRRARQLLNGMLKERGYDCVSEIEKTGTRGIDSVLQTSLAGPAPGFQRISRNG